MPDKIPMIASRLAIYTDLDGTLLDHHSYSHASVDVLLAELAEQHIPVIPCTSKTRAELIPLRQQLANQAPFIIENGAAVCVPHDYLDQAPSDTESQQGFWIKTLTHTRAHWLELINQLKPQFSGEFIGFSDLNTAQIAELTGLSPQQAEQAAQREFGEPLHWLSSDARKLSFIQAIEAQGARALQGGRFLHIGGHTDKGRALRWLNQCLAVDGVEPISIALGDSANDIAMLEAADYAVIVRSPVHSPPLIKHPKPLIITQQYGPIGWDEAIRRLLRQIQ